MVVKQKSGLRASLVCGGCDGIGASVVGEVRFRKNWGLWAANRSVRAPVLALHWRLGVEGGVEGFVDVRGDYGDGFL